MVENEKFFSKPTEDPWGIPTGHWGPTPSEDIDWSKVIWPVPTDVLVEFWIETAILKEFTI
jgi:hypothetical protein